MKKNVLSLMLISLLAVSIFSCSDKDEEDLSAEVGLIGKWTLQSADVSINGQSMEAYIKQLAEQMGVPEEQMGDMFDMDSEFTKGTTIEFQDSGVVIIDDQEGEAERGTWTSTEKTVTITIDNDPVTLDVKSLKNSSAVFAMSMEGLDDSEMEGNLAIEVIMNLSK